MSAARSPRQACDSIGSSRHFAVGTIVILNVVATWYRFDGDVVMKLHRGILRQPDFHYDLHHRPAQRNTSS